MDSVPPAVVIDTSVFVAAAFRPRSQSGRAVEAVRRGALRLVWDEPTRRETERIFRKIPPLSWETVAPLFSEENRHETRTDPAGIVSVSDPDDRKFAALASEARATLLTLDEHLLGAEPGAGCDALTPRDFLDRRR